MTSTAKTAIAPDVSYLADTQTADAADVLIPIEDLRDYVRAGRVAVTGADTHVKPLDDAISVGTGLNKSVSSPGADEALALTLASKLVGLHNLLPASGKIQMGAVDSEAATSGYVLTANGSGGALWAAAGGGGATPVDVTGTAGEALSERDAVYLAGDGTWYKIDADAVGGVRLGWLRGIVNAAGGISAAASGSIRILGEVSGFSGLTAWADVYASATAGGITQTKPTVSAGGAQAASVKLGFASSTTAVLVWPGGVEFLKRDSLAPDATLTVEHYNDAQARLRAVRGFVSSTTAGASLTGYADTNQDSSISLRETAAAGGTTTITASGSIFGIGTVSGADYWVAQSFQVAAGLLATIKFTLGANNGSPAGTMTWQICSDSAGVPGSVLATGTLTPTASAENTINVGGTTRLAASTTYWLLLKSTTVQSTGNFWQWQRSTTSVYGSGTLKHTNNGGSSWTDLSADGACAITTSAITLRDKCAQSFQLSAGATVDQVRLWLKKAGSPAGTMTLRIETDSAGAPSGTLADASASKTVAESGLGTSYAWEAFDFATDFSLSGSTTYWAVLSTDRAASETDVVYWGADSSAPGYASGEAKYEAGGAWSAESKDACFDVVGPETLFDEPLVLGRWSGGTRDLAVRFDDGTGGSGNSKTTFKNVSGGTLDITCVVELA